MTSSTLRPVPDRRNHASRLDLLRRVQEEFMAFPQLRLTPAQARRLFSLREDVCQRVLTELVRGYTLECGGDGRYGAPFAVGVGSSRMVSPHGC